MDEIVAQISHEISVLLPAFFGLLGVIIGGLIAHFGSKRQERERSRRDLTISLYNEFHSERMTNCRRVLYDKIHNGKGKSFNSIFDESTAEDRLSISIFLHYLERMNALVQANMVDQSLLKSILGRYLSIWFQDVFMFLSPEPRDSQWCGIFQEISELKKFKK